MHSPAHYAKGTPSPVPITGHRAPTACKCTVSGTFHSALAVLFIVQSPYSCAIGHRGVFSLGRWSGRFHAEFHELRATLVRLSTPMSVRRVRDCHPLWLAFPGHSAGRFSAQGARNPGTNPGLGSFAFARRYSRNRCLFLFLQVLRCFSSLRSLLPAYAFSWKSPCGGVSPFGYRRINSCLPDPRRFSQAAASFVASRCQDIHRTPLRA